MGYYSSMIFLIPAILFTLYAQAKIKGAYARYSQVASQYGYTGAQAAEAILRANGLGGIPIYEISGNLTDNYNPGKKIMNLSRGTYESSSVAAIGVAAHECGHAIQDAEGYGLLRFRNSIVPVVNLGSGLSWPLLLLGLWIGNSTGDMLFNAGVLLFCLVVLFHMVTLPVELDASHRALIALQQCGIVADEREAAGVRTVLSAAAMTYLASLAMAVANLLRILAMRGSRRR